MTDATIKSTVGIQMSPEGMTSAAKQLDSILQKTIKSLNEAGKTAEKAVTTSNKAGADSVGQINGQLKALAITLAQIKTLQNTLQSGGASGSLNSSRLLGNFGATGRLGKQARDMADYANSLRAGSSAMTTLRDRTRQFDIQAGNLAKTGKLLSNSQLMKAEKIEATAKAYSKINNELNSLRGRVSLLSSEGRKSLKPILDNLQDLEKANAKAFANPRRVSFDRELTSTRKAAQDLKETISLRERLEKTGRQNIEALRNEASALTNLTTRQREANLASQVRLANNRFNNASLTGTLISRRDTDEVSRFTRASVLAAVTQNQLHSALNKPNTSAERLQTLISRHKNLQREIAETISQQNRMDNKGGFFSGIKSSATNLIGGGAGAFGAGALVGRVAAYAGAATAVYGLISALQQALSFSIQFEDSLAQLQAISASTSFEMRDLSANIFAVAKNSSDSVLEITKSATAIAQAGYTGKELSQVLSASTNLSAASGASPADSVDILTSALGSFQLAGSEAANVADTLVAALNNSKLGITQLQSGLQYVGSVAADNNITLNELSGTLGVLADAGIRGSTAATGLRQFLVDLIDPSDKLIASLERVGLTTADIDVKVLGLSEVLRRLNDAGFQSFGSGLEVRAANISQALTANVDKLDQSIAATIDLGAAQEAADIRTQSVAATWNKMVAVLAEYSAAIGEDLAPSLKFLISILEAVLGSALAVVSAFTSLIGWTTSLGNEANSGAVSTQELQQALDDLGYSLEDVGLKNGDVVNGIEDLKTSMNATKAETDSLKLEQASLAQETEKLISRSDDLAGKNGNLTETTSGVRNAVDQLASRFPNLRAEFAKSEGGVEGLINSLMRLDAQAQQSLATLARQELFKNKISKVQGLNDVIETTAKYRARANSPTSFPIWMRDSKDRKDYSDIQKLLGTNPSDKQYYANVQKALAIGDQNARIGKEFTSVFQKANGGLVRMQQGRAGQKNAELALSASTYASSAEGQKLIAKRRYNSGYTTRAASQGSAGGKSSSGRLSELEKEKNDLADQISKTKDAGKLRILDQMLLDNNADILKLTSGSASSSKSGGSKSGGSSSGSGGAGNRTSRAARDYNKAEAEIEKEERDYTKKLYENKIEALRKAPTLDQLPDILSEIDSSLSEYLQNEEEASTARIEAYNPNRAQRTQLEEAAKRKAEELRVETIDKIASALNEAISKYIDQTTKAIERQYEQSLRFTERNVKLAEARLGGLNNPIGTQNVPEYFKTVKQRELDLAKDRFQRAQVPANETRISEYTKLIEKIKEEKADLEITLKTLGGIRKKQTESGDDGIVVTAASMVTLGTRLDKLDDDVLKYEDLVQDLKNTNDSLKASFEAAAEAPTTFSDGLRTAFEALKIEINSSGNLGQDIIKNLDQPLRTTHGAFKDFFKDVLSGSKSLGQAFKDMAGKIIDSILDIVAQALANQFFQLLGGVFGGAAGGGGGGFFSKLGSVLFPGGGFGGGLWRGGEIKNFTRGGQIASGLSTRDSTLIHAAKGEYVMRNSAVESIGTDMLDSMNSRGAAALKSAGSNIIPFPAQSPVQTNVYVIAPEEKPSLGPNDVIAIISKDVLQGGQTKRLIKKVANG